MKTARSPVGGLHLGQFFSKPVLVHLVWGGLSTACGGDLEVPGPGATPPFSSRHADAGNADGSGRPPDTPASRQIAAVCLQDSDCSVLQPCSIARCQPDGWGISLPAEDGSGCDDTNACTVDDSCLAALCGGKPVVCMDGNACTVDSCDWKIGCQNAHHESACVMADECDLGQCSAGACKVAPGSACDDGNPCTADDCTSAEGCVAKMLTGPACDDGNPCSIGDLCEYGGCAGQGPSCSDSNPCTIDSCTPDGGCSHTPHTGKCVDGDVCTAWDSCVDGTCVGSVKVCEDGNACTEDLCHPVVGVCVWTKLAACSN